MMSDDATPDKELKYDLELGAKSVRRTDIVIMLGKVVKALQTLQNVDRFSHNSDKHQAARGEADDAVKELAKWALQFIDGKEVEPNAE